MSGGLHWHWEPEMALPMADFAAVYMFGVGRLWWSAGPGRGIGYGAVAAFAGGMLALAIALFSPLAAMAEELFSAHMVVHEIIMAVAAPLIIWSRPWGAVAWAFPVWLSRRLRPLARIGGALAATLIQAAVIWAWHVPAFFRAAVEDENMHIFQHLTFFASALLFWHAMDRLSGRRAGAAVGWLFATFMHTGFLGALLLMAPRLWFPAQGGFVLSPLEDQQLGGAIMWVPGGLIYAGVALWVAGRWIDHGGAQPVPAGFGWVDQNRSKAKR
jgi:putative membrane protein